MNMTIRFADGSMANVMQQTDGNYVIILRRSGTYQVSAVRPNITSSFLGTFVTLARNNGGKIVTEYVA